MSMEETAVLLSIQPEWCSRIFSGWKTVEIRKTRPVSLKEPFKCYIYCTKGTKFFCWKAVDHLYFDDTDALVRAWPQFLGLRGGE